MRSLKTRLALISLTVFLVGIWSTAAYVSFELRKEMTAVLGEQQLSTVSVVAAAIDDEIRHRVSALETAAAHIAPHVHGGHGAMQTALEGLPLLHMLFSGGVRVNRADGSVAATVPFTQERMAANYADRDYFRDVLRDGKPSIGKPTKGRVIRSPVIGVAAPIFDEQRNISALLVGAIELSNSPGFDNLIKSPYGLTGGYLLLAPKHNLLVIGTDPAQMMQTAPPPGVNKMHDLYMQGHEGYGVATNSRGVEELSAAKKIPTAEWTLIAVLPTDEAFLPVRHMQVRIIFLATILSIVIGGAVWWLTGILLNREIAPILSTSRMLDKIHDLSSAPRHLPIPNTHEIGKLFRSFNQLLDALWQKQADLQLSQIKAERAAAAKSDFLANMSHELRSPLNAVLGYSEMMINQMAGHLPTVYQTYAKHIFDGARQELLIVNNLLDLAKIEAGKISVEEEEFCLCDVAVDAHATCTPQIQLGVKCECPGCDNRQWIAGSPQLIRQVLTNLLSNAAKYTPHGSIKMSCSVESGECQFSIEDTGIGMTESELVVAQTPFGRNEGNPYVRKSQGTGLGLTIVQNLVEMHNGRLDIKSRQGEGTVVTVHFPEDRTRRRTKVAERSVS